MLVEGCANACLRGCVSGDGVNVDVELAPHVKAL